MDATKPNAAPRKLTNSVRFDTSWCIDTRSLEEGTASLKSRVISPFSEFQLASDEVITNLHNQVLNSVVEKVFSCDTFVCDE